MEVMHRVAVFASGRGSNFLALQQAVDSGALAGHQVVLLVCDRPEALVVQHAENAGVPVFAFRPKDFRDKAEFEHELLQQLEQVQAEWVVLAGYMRLVGPTLLEVWEGRMINLHPSLLPAFPGKDAIGQAWRAKVSETGVTVHFVDAGMDTGAVIAQERVPILADDTESTLAERIHSVEHRLLPEVLRTLTSSNPQRLA